MYAIHFLSLPQIHTCLLNFLVILLMRRGQVLFAIYIIKQKENATATENTYELTVQLKSRSSEMVTSQDFIANTAELTISPNQEKVIYPVTILDDRRT